MYNNSKKITFILSFFAFIAILFIMFNSFGFINIETRTFETGNVIYKFDPQNMKKVMLNRNQIIYINKDGIRAFNKDGSEIWSNTLSFSNIIIDKCYPYFALSEYKGNKILVFSDKGLLYEITVKNQITNFNINQNGEVAVIESLSGGHIISGYDSNGRDLGVSSGTFINNGDYPMSAVISPNGEYIIVASLYLNNSKLESTVGAILTHKPKEVITSPMYYSNKEIDNLLYNIEFISDDIFASIGDKFLTFYDIDGQFIREISTADALFKISIDEMTSLGGFIPIITAISTTHDKNYLVILNQIKEYIVELDFDAPIKYFNANASGVVIGDGLSFKGYNRIGKETFRFFTKQDIKEVIANNYMAIAVTNDSIIRLVDKRGF
ncbi:hypothetical protein AN641_05450 [Candidatus Epulonipiscioides gigas]|nr:hypothetical protein AN641_05450 [Epulopiscium sp. SCG-C07WGA-EpuloA2]